jgi:hypothetical protein
MDDERLLGGSASHPSCDTRDTWHISRSHIHIQMDDVVGGMMFLSLLHVVLTMTTGRRKKKK